MSTDTPETPTRCQVPPPGWWCSRSAGHDGPCAARSWPEDPRLSGPEAMSTDTPEAPTRCRAVAALGTEEHGRLNGVVVRCELDAGHDVDIPADVESGVTWGPAIPATPHRVAIEWESEPEPSAG